MKINSYLLIALLLAASILLIIFIPRWQEESYRNTINSEDVAKLEPKDRVQLQKDLALVENSFRTTLAQIIGGSLLLLSLYLTYRNVKIGQENARIANENLRVVEEGKLTDRFSKAVELLGNEKLEVRLGGIYALERIARDSQKDHWTVMEVLTAFVRENSHKKLEETAILEKKTAELHDDESEKEKAKAREDIQAILTVIGRRERAETESPKRLDLMGVKLESCDLWDANLSGANLWKANLSGADLSGANLSGANLSEAFLNGTFLREANICSADLSSADLSGSHLLGADLSGTNLIRADLSGSHLSSADLSEADLSEANLSGADLSEANLSRSHLWGANLNGAGLSGANLSEADLNRAKLSESEGLQLKQLLSAENYESAELPWELEKELKEELAKFEKFYRVP